MSRVSSSIALWLERKAPALWSGISPAPRGGPGSAPCRTILALGDGSASIGLGAFGVTDGDLAGQIATILGGRRAEAAKAAAAQASRTLPGVRAPSAPPPAAAASGPTQMVVLARMLADERRQTLDALGQASGDGGFAGGARQLDHSMRRWRAFAMTEEIRGLAMISDRVKSHASAIAELFDADFYKSTYGDRVWKMDNPLLHYVLIGWRTGFAAPSAARCAVLSPPDGGRAGRPAPALCSRRRCGRARSLSPVRHRFLSRAFHERRGGCGQSAAALPDRRGRGAVRSVAAVQDRGFSCLARRRRRRSLSAGAFRHPSQELTISPRFRVSIPGCTAIRSKPSAARR